MGTSKAMIKKATTMIKLAVGAKKYYVAIGGAMMTSFMLSFIVSSMILKIFFIVNAIGLFLLVVNDDEQTNIFDII